MHGLEHLPVRIPNFDGHHPFSRGQKPAYYKPNELADSAEGKTRRTSFFEKYLVGLYWTLGRAVPYAFRTADGEIRSLDAGCLKFLLNRSPPGIALVCDAGGTIVAVEPGAALIELYAPMRSKLIKDLAPVGLPSAREEPQLSANLPFDLSDPADERRKSESEHVVREGAQAFRKAILQTWSGRCAVTRTDVPAVLDAAHIHPYLGPRTNDVRNGIPLRSDLHRLFDRFLLTFLYDNERLTIHISEKLHGSEYSRYEGQQIELPNRRESWPDLQLVAYHFSEFAARERISVQTGSSLTPASTAPLLNSAVLEKPQSMR